MSAPRHRTPSSAGAALRRAAALLLAALAGCSTASDLDPAQDFRDASALVAARSPWQPSWNAPWAHDSTSWDGRAPLTVDAAVTIALQDNRGLRAELEGIAAARADLVQSGLLPNPVLSYAMDKTHVGDAVAWGLVQELTQLWLIPAQRDAAAMALREQVQTVSDHALRLAADVRAAHARVVFGQRGLVLTEAQIDLIRRSLDVAQRRVDVGDGTSLDVNRLREELLSTQADLEQQQVTLETARRDLLAMLGRAAADADWQAADEPPPDTAALSALTESQAVDRACRLRLDVQAAQSLFEQRRHELRAANLGSIPEVSAGLDDAKNEDALRFRGWELDVEIPVFDTNDAAVAKAQSDLRRSAAETEQVVQTAISQTRSAFLALQASLRQATLFRDQVIALATDNLDLAQRSYDAGEADLTVVLDTQRELGDSRAKLNDLELAVATSAAELEYVVGGKL